MRADNDGAINLEPTQTCDVGVTFRPTSAGAKTAAVRVTSNAGGTAGNIVSTAISGTGVDPTAPDFDLALSSAASITLDHSATSTVNLTVNRRNGFAGDVVVTISSTDPGITADTLTIPASATTGVLTLHTNSSIVANTYVVNIIGTSGGLSHAVTLSVGVNADVTPIPPPSGSGGGGCSLGEASSSFGLLFWMFGLVSMWALRRRK
ncbi:MAG: hypothetical protein HQM15_09745 [Deltaproteobacteria bacterium]|nr:hypothetical protein [Deltaproteobacteria bacterium]